MDKHFELKVAGSQVLLRVLPPEKNQRANLNEIQKELQALGANFRVDNLFEVFRRASNEFEPVGVREATDYEVLVNVSENAQEAYLTVIPPISGRATLHPAKIKDALESSKIEKGILYDEIKRILLEKIEGQPVLIAKGRLPVHGQDGYIQFYGKSEEHVAVETNRADYKELNMIDNVEEEDLVARVVPPTHAEDGYSVYGRELKGQVGKPAKIKVGRNVKRSEEGTEVFATKSGFIVLSGNKVSVEDIMRVKDVDPSTGNIRFTGVVQISGQVQDGFSVEAGHGIQVSGTPSSSPRPPCRPGATWRPRSTSCTPRCRPTAVCASRSPAPASSTGAWCRPAGWCRRPTWAPRSAKNIPKSKWAWAWASSSASTR